MKIYLVGGAVRDQLLNQPVTEKDWLVVGATTEQMLALGYRQVGKDFPVFLHPQTQEEYALARTERKQGSGYTGFVCHASPEVTLEEDLLRRDLTINAIAMDAEGQLIDPYQGQKDLAEKTLRHISPAFSEDPLRVLRVARFASRYAPLGFEVATETLELMQQMSNSGELEALARERIWKETERALSEPEASEVYFQVLAKAGAMDIIIPSFQQNQNATTQLLQQGLKRLRLAKENPLSLPQIFSATLMDIYDLLACSRLSEQKLLLERIKQQLRLPNTVYQFARLYCQFLDFYRQLPELDAVQIITHLKQLGFLRPENHYAELQENLQLLEAELNHPQRSKFLNTVMQNILAIKPQTLIQQGLQGQALGEAIAQEQQHIIQKLLTEFTLA